MIQFNAETQESTFAEDQSESSHWYALYTRSQHEKIVDRELQKKGIETFLPLRKVTRNWSDRKKIITEPLFKGYLFVQTSPREKTDVLKTVGAVSFVGNRGKDPIQVPEKEIRLIQKFIKEAIQIDPFPYLKEGALVYVRSGPFKGVEGFIVRKDRRCRLVISLDLLMQSISVEIDQACVELI